MDRSERQLRIIQLVKSNLIETQEDLVCKLRDSGYNVTQATVSRDIKELGLIKVAYGGRYKYAVATQSPKEVEISSTMLSLFREVVLHIDSSLNLVVVRTKPGNASSVAAMLDGIAFEHLLGTVSGDDTIIMVVDGIDSATAIADRLRSMQ